MLLEFKWKSAFQICSPETSDSLAFHSRGYPALQFTNGSPRTSSHFPRGIEGGWVVGGVVASRAV